MPIVDTQFLFALNPKDKHHTGALNILEKVKIGEVRDLVVTDTAIFEYYLVLRSRGVELEDIKSLFGALNEILGKYGIKELKTLNKDLFVKQISIEKDHDLNFFDSLLAASAENYDHSIISSDKVYDKLGLKRIPLGGEKL